jgi:hypothetical protein
MKKYIVFFVLLISTVCFSASQQTSTTTAGSIVDRAETLLNDSDNEMWTAGELLQYLNDGMVDIVSRSHCLEAVESINLATDTLEYTITSTYLTVKAVHYIDASGIVTALRKGSPASVGLVSDSESDTPVWWYDWAGKVGVYPLLTRTNETINVYLITRPTAIATGTNVTTPAIYDTALTYYIVAQAYKRDKSHAKYLQTMALYEAEMNRYRQDLNDYPREPVEN